MLCIKMWILIASQEAQRTETQAIAIKSELAQDITIYALSHEIQMLPAVAIKYLELLVENEAIKAVIVFSQLHI